MYFPPSFSLSPQLSLVRLVYPSSQLCAGRLTLVWKPETVLAGAYAAKGPIAVDRKRGVASTFHAWEVYSILGFLPNFNNTSFGPVKTDTSKEAPSYFVQNPSSPRSAVVVGTVPPINRNLEKTAINPDHRSVLLRNPWLHIVKSKHSINSIQNTHSIQKTRRSDWVLNRALCWSCVLVSLRGLLCVKFPAIKQKSWPFSSVLNPHSQENAAKLHTTSNTLRS